jgi:Meckel syndrome type 1 protein
VPKASFLSGRRGWIGGALAASVAVAALFVARPLGNGSAPTIPGATPAQVAEASSAPASTGADVRIPKAPLAPAPAVDLGTAAVAAAEVPRRAIERRSSRSQSQRAALRASARRESATVSAVATAAAPAVPSAALASDALAPSANVATDPADPFRPQQGEAVARPWPRAVLPQYSSAGGINASYGASSPSFYPFEPSMPQEGAPATVERNPPPSPSPH